MTREITLAKNAGLNWQVLVIEEAQLKIKELVAMAVLYSSADFLTKVNKVIAEVEADIDTVGLREKATQGLREFAKRLYYQTRLNIQRLDLKVVGAFILLGETTKVSDMRKALEVLKKNIPDLANTIDSIKVKEWYNEPDIRQYRKSYMDKVKEVWSKLSSSNAKYDYDSKVSLRNVAEMDIREQKHIKELERMVESGNNLVWISTHANCSERCEPWQGKMYSLDNTYGTFNGTKYQPLSNATDIYAITKSGKTYKNGIISGFNCRHFITPATNKKPQHITAEVIQKERDINDTQRYLERGVRMYREQAILFKPIDKALASLYRDKAVEWNSKYIKFSLDNKVPYFSTRVEVFRNK